MAPGGGLERVGELEKARGEVKSAGAVPELMEELAKPWRNFEREKDGEEGNGRRPATAGWRFLYGDHNDFQDSSVRR